MDMALAMTLELKEDFAEVNSVTTILKLHPNNTAKSLDYLFKICGEVSDIIFIQEKSALYENAINIFKNNNVPYKLYDKSSDVIIADDVLENAFLFRSHADLDHLSLHLGSIVRQNNNKVYVFLDGCYPPFESIPVKYFNKSNAKYADIFLLNSINHKKAIESVGYKGRTRLTGYFKLYKQWLKRSQKEGKRKFIKYNRNFKICVFTRGERLDQPPENQLLTNKNLKQILKDIFYCSNQLFTNYKILIKPHPAQDLSVFEDISCKHSELVEDHPAVLASVSDMVITTWSTSAIDAIAAKVPCIEYFMPTNYFKEIYPKGSSFRYLNILVANNHNDLMECMLKVRNKAYIPPEPSKILQHKNLLTDALAGFD
jgi:hypothetical protein